VKVLLVMTQSCFVHINLVAIVVEALESGNYLLVDVNREQMAAQEVLFEESLAAVVAFLKARIFIT
jgi:hypothetical protein